MSTIADRTTTVTGAWQSDPTHSTIGFGVVYMGITPFEGAFRDFDATLDEHGLRGTARATSARSPDPAGSSRRRGKTPARR